MSDKAQQQKDQRKDEIAQEKFGCVRCCVWARALSILFAFVLLFFSFSPV
jgi:hypothetical protein